MVSPFQLLGYFLQISGMAVMFFGFANLVVNIQGEISSVMGSISAEAGGVQTAPDSDTLQKTFEERVKEFIVYLAMGIILVFAGLLLRASGEIGGALGFFRKKEPTARMRYGKLEWPNPR